MTRQRFTATVEAEQAGWFFTLGPMRQRADLPEDLVTALTADPKAAAFFDTLAQFYRKAYLAWIDGTKRQPDLRARRIAEVVALLAAGVKQRPR